MRRILLGLLLGLGIVIQANAATCSSTQECLQVIITKWQAYLQYLGLEDKDGKAKTPEMQPLFNPNAYLFYQLIDTGQKAFSQTLLSQLLATDKPSTTQRQLLLLFMNPNNTANVAKALSASDPRFRARGAGGVQTDVQKEALNKLNLQNQQTLNLDSLLNVPDAAAKEGYDPELAKQFIKFVTGFYTALPVKTAKEYKSMSGSEQQKYLARIWTYFSRTSVGLSNYYHLLNERTPIKDLAKSVKSPNDDSGMLPSPNASPIEVQRYLAQHRLRSKKWADDLKTDPPIVLQQKMVRILAEMEMQQQKIYEQNARILATMSALQMQGLDTTKQGIQFQAQQRDMGQ